MTLVLSGALLAVGRTAAHPVPTGVGYSLLLLAHVASAVVGFGAICLTGFHSSRVRHGPDGPKAKAVARYFRPGANWAGRALYGVPVFGFALLASSRGAFDASDTFVIAGLLMWLAAAVVAEAVVWPGERRIQAAVARGWGEVEEGSGEDLVRESKRVTLASALLAVVFVAAVVVMVGKP